MKYNLDELHWQEFEVLIFKVIQIMISPAVQFIEGGNDKGRDIIYEGKAKEYNSEYTGKWIFQAKHKAKMILDKELSALLVNDLKDEMSKVFITNKLECDNYILVTNKTIKGSLLDLLNETFQEFKIKEKIKCDNFNIISYRHIETCIDNHPVLKWSYPNIISHPDFALLIKDTLTSHLNTRKKAWLNVLEKQRKYFVYTSFFQKANDKLSEFPAIILSGPPKSGKTFNAEMLALNYSTFNNYEPIIIDNPDEIESSYEASLKQIFICDDAFGKYVLSYRSEDWFNKLERIFNLADENHLFIFTSREYVFRAFINFGNEDAKSFLEKIIVESHNYADQEKLAILNRYITLSKISETDKENILLHEIELVKHKNFSPETIRAFFANIDSTKNGLQLKEFKLHLDTPDSYLSLVFFKLPLVKQAALLAVLCTVKNNEPTIHKTFEIICNDLEINILTNSQLEFDELDDSILRILRTDKVEEIAFYHPSMHEFLTRQITTSETGKLREIVLRNLNIDLLSLSVIKPAKGSLFSNEKQPPIKLNIDDLQKVLVGLTRLITNREISLYEATAIFQWFKSDYHLVDLKFNDAFLFKSAKEIIYNIIRLIEKQAFYNSHQMQKCSTWSKLFFTLKHVLQSYGVQNNEHSFAYFSTLLKDKVNENSYWMLVFRILSLTNDNYIMEEVGKTWLNKHFIEMRKEIYELGEEIFGDDFPEFNVYNQNRNKTVEEKLKHKPSNTWFPRFLIIKDKMDTLKEIKGSTISNTIIERLTLPYDEILKYSDYGKNRHVFNVKKGWWKSKE